MQAISFYDAANESYYHGMIVGLCAMMINSFRITSNRESGNGRYLYDSQVPDTVVAE